MKSQAAILVKQNEPLQMWELEVPPLQKGQVLVEMAYSGLCHTQLNEIKGAKGEDRFLPHTLGHEGSGVVVDIGEDVSKVKAGDHVVLSWIKGKGHDVPGCCYQSAHGKVNSGAISTFLTHAIISENRVVPIDKRMPLKEAALLGCALPTGAGVVKNEMQLQAGNSFAVFGVGGVGLSALIAAKLFGANPIIAVDVQDEKLELAKQFGATHVVHAHQEDPAEVLKEITGGGVDYIFESAGKRLPMEQAFSALKSSGLCVLAGNLPKGEKIQIDPFDLICGKRIIGTWGGKSRIDKDVADYVALFLQEKIPLEDLITHEASLSKINQLFAALERAEVGRAVIDLMADSTCATEMTRMQPMSAQPL